LQLHSDGRKVRRRIADGRQEREEEGREKEETDVKFQNVPDFLVLSTVMAVAAVIRITAVIFRVLTVPGSGSTPLHPRTLLL
jgi:hypothetical protein